MKKISLIWLILTGMMLIIISLDNILMGINDIDLRIIDIVSYVVVTIWGIFTLILFFCILFQSIYLKSITKKMSNEEMILLCLSMENNPKKFFFVNDKRIIRQNLGTLYLIKNDIDKARKYLANVNSNYCYIYEIYPIYLVAVYDNNIEDMDKYYNKLMKVKNKKLDSQKQSAMKIKNMIEKQTFDESLYLSTHYDIVKEICLRYKK